MSVCANLIWEDPTKFEHKLSSGDLYYDHKTISKIQRENYVYNFKLQCNYPGINKLVVLK